MELPLFPLHVVLFPGRPLPLQIFEPRYQRMLKTCLEGDRRFGVVAIRSGAETRASSKIYSVGTVARIESVDRHPQGRTNITTRGLERFRVRRLLDPSPYLRAHVEVLVDEPGDPAQRDCAHELRRLLVPYLAQLGAPPQLLERLPAEPDQLAYLAAAAVQVDLPRQQELLELDSTAERIAATLSLLRRETGIMRHLGAVGSLRPPGPGGADLN